MVVSASFATAAMSPAGTSDAGSCSLPRITDELVQPFVVHGAAVHERGVGLHRALQHLEEVHVADVRVDDGLEHERDRRAVARVGGRGPFLGDELREPVDADELRRAAAQHREHRARRDAERQRVRELGDSIVSSAR